MDEAVETFGHAIQTAEHFSSLGQPGRQIYAYSLELIRFERSKCKLGLL